MLNKSLRKKIMLVIKIKKRVMWFLFTPSEMTLQKHSCHSLASFSFFADKYITFELDKINSIVNGFELFVHFLQPAKSSPLEYIDKKNEKFSSKHINITT